MCSTEWADPLIEKHVSSFYRLKEGRCTCIGDRESRRLLPESQGYSGRALWEVHCGVCRRAWQSSWASSLVLRRSRRRPGGSSGRRGRCCGVYRPPGVAWRRSEGPIGQGSCPGQGRSCFRGLCPCRSRTPRKEKYEGGMGSWQYSSWSSAEHVLHCVAGSHSVATASGMAEQCPELAEQ